MIERAEKRFKISKPIIVADSGLLSQSNIIMLSELGYEFIIGARIRNESDIIKKEIQNKLQEIKNNNHAEVVKVVKDKEFRLIVGYSEDRVKHDVYRRNKGVAKLRKKHNAGYLTKKDICNKGYNKFLSLNCNQIEVTIDENKIIQNEMWEGLKGYMTNSKMTSEEIQSNYSHLWQIEKAFRISKTDLRIRPIYHRKKNRIEAHICIVFATYAVFKTSRQRYPNDNYMKLCKYIICEWIASTNYQLSDSPELVIYHWHNDDKEQRFIEIYVPIEIKR